MAKIDDLFFELSIKRGPGTDQEVARFTGALKAMGKTADGTADDLEDVADATDRVDKEAKQATGTFGRLFQRLRGAAGTVTAVSAGFLAVRAAVTDVFRAVRGLVTGFANLVQRGGEVTNVARAFTRVVGDQEAALNTLRSATQGLISDFDLMVQFNRAIALGSAENVEQFAKLSETALTLGRSLGVDAAFALESLNLGIGRQSRLILDNLGLIVSVEQANLAYAASLDKTVEQLTLQEKRQAFVNAALTAAEQKIEELGGTQLTAADNLTRLNVAFTNFRDRLATAIANSPVVAQAISALTDAFNGLFAALESLIGIEAVEPGEFVDLSGLEEIILFFRTLPAELDVLSARVGVVTETIATFFARAFGRIIDAQQDLLRTLAERFIDFSDLLINRFNPAVQLAAAGAAEFLERLGQAQAEDVPFAAAAEQRLATARQELLAAEEVLDATRARALAEVDLTRRIAARRAAAGDAGVDVEAGVRAFQALEKAITAATVTAAEKSLEAVEELEANFIGAFGEIPDEARKELGQLRAIAEEALGRERAEQLGKEFAERFTQELEAIDLAVLVGDIGAEEGQQQRLDILAAQRAEIEEQLRLRQDDAQAVRELNKLLGQILRAQKGITDEVEDTAEARRKKEVKAIEDSLKAQKETVDTIALAASGVADLANAFGLVDDASLRVIDNVIQLGQAISATISSVQALSQGVGSLANVLSGAIGGIGAIAGIVGGLFGGGPSAAEQAAEAVRRTLDENTDALRDLTRSADELRGTFDITGSDFARALQQLTGAQTELAELAAVIEDLRGRGGPFVDILEQILDSLEQELRALGIDLANLDDVAAELGITIRDDAGRLIPEALLQLQQALSEVSGDLVGFANTIEGAFARLRAEIEIFDIEDPIEQFALLQQRLLEIQQFTAEDLARINAQIEAEGLTGLQAILRRTELLGEAFREAGRNLTPFLQELLAIDVTAAEGREQAEALIRSLFQQLAAGIITPEELGAATFEEAVEILREMESLLDDIEEQGEDTGAEQEGQTQDIRRQVQITELQAAQLLAFQATQTELLRQIRDILRGGAAVDGAGFEDAVRDMFEPRILPIPPPEPPAPGAVPFTGEPLQVSEGPVIGEVNVQADISVGAGATPEQAEEVRTILVDDIATELGERLLDAERQVGLPRFRRERLSR